MSKKILLPSIVINKSSLSKCVKCNLNIERGLEIASIPTITVVGNNTYIDRARMHIECFGQTLQEKWEKEKARNAEKMAKERADAFVTTEENPCKKINLAEPKVVPADGRAVDGPSYQLSWPDKPAEES